MTDIKIAEERILAESPVHGPELLAEIKTLRDRVEEITGKWAADDHEARMLRFALHDIETAANAEGRPAIAHMAKVARLTWGQQSKKVKAVLDAAWEVLEDEFPKCSDGGLGDKLRAALEPFRGLK